MSSSIEDMELTRMPTLEPTDPRAMELIVAQARARFVRVLSNWTMDVFELRRRQQSTPTWEPTPSALGCQGDALIEPMNRVFKRAA